MKQKENFLTSFFNSYRYILFIIIYTIVTISMILGVMILSHSIYKYRLLEIISSDIYYILMIALVVIIPAMLFARSYNENISLMRLVKITVVYVLMNNLFFLKWEIIENNQLGFYIFSMIVSMFITFFIINKIYKLVNWIKEGYIEAVENSFDEDKFDAQSKLVTIVVSICFTSTASILAISLSIYKLCRLVYKIILKN